MLYLLAILLDLIMDHPPYARPDTAGQVTYQVCGLIVGLLPLILIGLSLRSDHSPIQKLQGLFSTLSLPAKGFVLTICAVTLKSAFALCLLFPLPDSAFTRMGSAFETTILLLKWGGLGLLSWGQLRLLGQKTRIAETSAKKLQSQIMYGFAIILFLVAIAWLFSSDVSGITSRF